MKQPIKRRTWGGTYTYPTPKGMTRYTWHTYYEKVLIDLYTIFVRNMEIYYPKLNIDWSDNDVFNDFSRLIYNVSSKHLS